MNAPSLPPLLRGQSSRNAAFPAACRRAGSGCDPGLVVWRDVADCLDAAIVLAPEVPLCDAMAMLPTCAVGLQNALGALGPPELAIQFDWNGGIFANGAACGRLRAAASGPDPAAEPDWLVVGLHVDLLPGAGDSGLTPDRTWLYLEGCGDIEPRTLLESWSRHTLAWIHRWNEEGAGPVHAEWLGLVRNVGSEVEVGGTKGTFIGLDERFGLLLRNGATTRVVAMTSLLEAQR